MRKTAVIAALLSFLVCLLAGYYAALWRGEQHPAETEAHAVLERKKADSCRNENLFINIFIRRIGV